MLTLVLARFLVSRFPCKSSCSGISRQAQTVRVHRGLVLLAFALVFGIPGAVLAMPIQTPSTTTDVTPPPGGTTEDVPNSPGLVVLWKAPDAIKLQWSDRSNVETSFTLEQETEPGRWLQVASFARQPGNSLTHNYVLRGFEPEHHYCLRMVAHNARGDSQDIARSHACTTTTASGACPEKVMDSLLTLANDNQFIVDIPCNLTLEPSQVVTKQLRLIGADSSGITIDLNGAILDGGPGTYNDGRDMLVIQSRETVAKNSSETLSEYSRPEGIVVKNGTILGGVRVFGMARNGQGDPDPGFDDLLSNQLKKSSHLAGHTDRVRANAPTDILLDRLTIKGSGRVPLYVAPGVTHLTFQNSWVLGSSKGPAIYLDAESGFNVIRGNSIDVDTAGHFSTFWDRPSIAIDGSSHNQIVDNHFSDLKNGGIFLYRNCGEGGVIRHETPSFNHIVNNIFYYVNYGEDDGVCYTVQHPNGPETEICSNNNPAIYLASRDRGGVVGDVLDDVEPWNFCDEDDGYPLGSSASNKDYAQHNVVMQNQVYERELDYAIQTKNASLNSPNSIFRNETVTPSTVENRPADCTWGLEEGDYLPHGNSFEKMETYCKGTRFTCDDGRLIEEPIERNCTINPNINGNLNLSGPKADSGSSTRLGAQASTVSAAR